MRKLLKILLILGSFAGVILWLLSAPSYVSNATFENLVGNGHAGEQVFYQSGCASCHAAPKATGDAKLVLSGGKHFPSDFGTFIAPNISPDPEYGIGEWGLIDFANALQKGVRPDGAHYYPAFPYTSYARMTPQDVTDLYQYIKTLPASQTLSQPHKLGFPFNIRRGLGLWKRLFAYDGNVIVMTDDPVLLRGRYLVEGLGHCGECHTPRNVIGGLKRDKWLGGGPNPDGPGKIPNITPHADGIGSWLEADIVYYLQSGFTPDYDSAGGTMVAVIENTSKLSDVDLLSIAKYLKTIPAIPKQ